MSNFQVRKERAARQKFHWRAKSLAVYYTRPMRRQPNNTTPHQPALTRRDLLRTGLGVAGAGLLAGCGLSTAHSGPPVPAPTSTIVPSPTADTRPVTVAITGDIMMARAVGARIKAGPSDSLFPFADTADVLKSHDLRIGNLECVVSKLGSPQPKTYTFEAPLQAFERLRAAGFQIVSVANNHSGDYGKAAFSDMLAHLPTYGITPVGGGANRTEAHRLVTHQVRTTTIGILAYCEIEPSSFAATATTPGHAWLEATAMKQDIAAARSQVDFLIVFTHWGVEYVLQENAHQQYMARLAVDAGADLVVGAHPHVIEPYEMYHGKPIIYSLGNFVFDEMPGVTGRCNVLSFTVQGSRLLDWKLRGASIIFSTGAPVWNA